MSRMRTWIGGGLAAALLVAAASLFGSGHTDAQGLGDDHFQSSSIEVSVSSSNGLTLPSGGETVITVTTVGQPGGTYGDRPLRIYFRKTAGGGLIEGQSTTDTEWGEYIKDTVGDTETGATATFPFTAGAGPDTVTFEIRVGTASGISIILTSTDFTLQVEGESGPASLMVSPASGTEVASGSDGVIAVTVRDENGELVDSTPVTIQNVSGPATLANAVNKVATANTVGGIATFAYNAGRGPASIVFTITAGDSLVWPLSLVVAPEPGASPPSLNVAVTPQDGALFGLGSNATITVTVTNDAGVAVGPTLVTVEHISGGGSLEGGGAASTKTTVNGVATFSYTAPDQAATANFHVLVGASNPVARTLRLNISPYSSIVTLAPTQWSGFIVGGWNNLIWLGAQGASVASGVPGDVTAVWYWNGTSWNAWFADAAQTLPEANTLSTLRFGGTYWVLSSAGHDH